METFKENMYAFFTRTGKEKEAAKEIRKFYVEKSVNILNLSVEMLFKSHGKVSYEVKPIYSGYLFITTPMSNEEFILSSKECIKRSNNVMKLLQYGDSGIAAIKLDERKLLESLLQGEKFLKVSRGFQQGSRVIITEGPWVGKESFIKSINRHKRQALIELQVLGEIRQITVGLEIIAKYQEDDMY